MLDLLNYSNLHINIFETLDDKYLNLHRLLHGWLVLRELRNSLKQLLKHSYKITKNPT